MLRRPRTAFLIVLSTALLAAGVLLTNRPRAAAAPPEDPAELKGKAAPDFTATTADGQKVKLADLKKNVVVLDFWATWCVPCRQSLPHLSELAADKDLAARGLKVFAVNAKEEKEDVDGFLKKNKFAFTTLLDEDGAIEKAFGIGPIPITVIVGRDGKVYEVLEGFKPEDGPARLKAAIDRALKAEAK